MTTALIAEDEPMLMAQLKSRLAEAWPDLVVEVADSGRGLVESAAQPGSGVGLANVRERLAALYGSRGRFTLAVARPQGTTATLEIPVDEADEPRHS